MLRESFSSWYKSGSPFVWLNAGAVSISLVMVVGLLLLIGVRGLGHFWPNAIMESEYRVPGQTERLIVGEIVEVEEVSSVRLAEAGMPVVDKEVMQRDLIKIGNRDVSGGDFVWVLDDYLADRRFPQQLMAVERREWGNFYGRLKAVYEEDRLVASGEKAWPVMLNRIERALDIHKEIYDIEKHQIGSINSEIERLRLRERGLQLRGETDPRQYALIAESRKELELTYSTLETQLGNLYVRLNRDRMIGVASDGTEVTMTLGNIVRAYRPNAMSLMDKVGFYGAKIWEFVSDDPREANTEGGIFPAIFGTVMMVILMSIIVTPFGVIAAVYLREYAKQGPVTRAIRIAVNNLAGVPSIVYGVFGLGFFVYFMGSGIDQMFFPEALPAPTLGTPGLLWASITLALLTLPVVIVATEEGLSRIPSSVREGSLALGATKAETLWRVVLPMSSPAMMTGLILAVARAAGEVAPLMLVGVVKLAPSLPLDGNYPYLHLDQKFMHLGFHIFDVGFQSPNVEAARPLVYATALLLVVVIAVLNLSAVYIRNHLREKYKALEV